MIIPLEVKVILGNISDYVISLFEGDANVLIALRTYETGLIEVFPDLVRIVNGSVKKINHAFPLPERYHALWIGADPPKATEVRTILEMIAIQYPLGLEFREEPPGERQKGIVLSPAMHNWVDHNGGGYLLRMVVMTYLDHISSPQQIWASLQNQLHYVTRRP